MKRTKKLTKHQAQQLGLQSALLSEKCTGRIAGTKTFPSCTQPTIVAKTVRTFI